MNCGEGDHWQCQERRRDGAHLKRSRTESCRVDGQNQAVLKKSVYETILWGWWECCGRLFPLSI